MFDKLNNISIPIYLLRQANNMDIPVFIHRTLTCFVITIAIICSHIKYNRMYTCVLMPRLRGKQFTEVNNRMTDKVLAMIISAFSMTYMIRSSRAIKCTYVKLFFTQQDNMTLLPEIYRQNTGIHPTFLIIFRKNTKF